MSAEILTAMIEAAMVARRESARANRAIEICVTERGFAIAGRTRVGGNAFGTSHELDWPEFEGNPLLLTNSVRLVAVQLQRAEQ